VFGTVIDEDDRAVVQEDLQKLSEWADSWQMEFNVEKCKVMHFGSQNNKFNYFMRGKQLEVFSVERDLGVIIASNLKVADHCHQAYATANRMLWLVARTVKHRNINIMVQLYKSLVRPHLEYSTSV